MGRIGIAELLILLIPALVVYFIPTIIATSRNHSNKIGIFLLNLFLGWTFVGWLGSLIWSVTSTGKQTVVVNNHYQNANKQESQIKDESKNTTTPKQDDYDGKIDRLQKLKQLLDSGVLSEEEFAKEKSKILAD
jgi:hypothetical protein